MCREAGGQQVSSAAGNTAEK